MATEILFKLKVDTSGGKAEFEKIKRDLDVLEAGANINVDFKNLKSLSNELRQLETVRDNAFDFDTAKAAVKEINRVEQEIEDLNKDLAKTDGKGFLSGIADSVKNVDVGQVADFALGGLLSGGLTAAADLAVQGVTKVIDIGSAYQSSMAELSAITGVAGDALGTLGGDFRDLATEFGTSAVEQIEAGKGVLSRLGPDIASVPEALKEITRDINVLSKATGDDAAASMDALTTAALQFGTDLSDPTAAAEDITKKMNTMAAGAKVGAAEVPQVADALRQAGVAAKSANLSFEETNAAIQVLAAGGKFGSEGGVAIRNVIGLMQKQSGEGKKALQGMGIEADKLGEILTTQGLGPALEELKGGLSGLGSDAERNATLITLFGQESAGAAGILLDSTDKLNDFTAGVTNTNTAFEQAAIRQDTFSEKMAKVGAFFEDIAITIFEGVGSAISFVIDNFEELALASVLLTGGITLIPVAIGELVAHFGDISDAIGSVVTDVGSFLGVISDVDAANQNAARSVKSIAKSFEEYQEKVGEVDAKLQGATGTSDQVERLEQLRTKTELTADEQKELSKITNSLADAFPEATAGVSDLTGEYDLNIQKLKELSEAEKAQASSDKKALVEENLIGPLKDSIVAIEAQKEKLAELNADFKDAAAGGDNDDILETKAAYDSQRESVKKSTEQQKQLLTALVQSGQVGKGSAEEIAKALGISRAEAEKLVPKVQEVNKNLAEQKQKADEVAQSAAGMATAFNEAAAAADKQFQEQLGALNALDLKIQENNKKRRTASADDKKRIDQENAELRKQRKDQLKDAIVADKENDSVKAIATRNAAIFEQKQGESIFQQKLKAIDTNAKLTVAKTKEVEANIQKTIVDQVIAGNRKTAELTTAESKARIARGLADKQEELNALEALAKRDATGAIIDVVGTTDKDRSKDLATLKERIAGLTKDIADAKLDEFKLKPTVDSAAKFNDAVDALIDAGIKHDIEVGIRPKEDQFDLFDKEIKRLKRNIAAETLELTIDTQTGNLLGVQESVKSIITSQNKINAIKSDSAKLTTDLSNEITDAQIANIEKEEAREIAALKAKQDRELQAFAIQEAGGIPLTERQLALKKELEKRHLRELRDLRLKFYEDDKNIQIGLAKSIQESIMSIMQDAAAGKALLSSAEVDDKNLSYEKQFQLLQANIQKGEISQREFNVKMKLLDEERANFEKEQNAGANAVIVDQTLEAIAAVTASTFDYFDKLAQSYIQDEILNQILQDMKVAAVQDAADRKAAADSASITSSTAAASAGGLAAVVEAVKSAIIGLPFPINIAASIAAGLAVSKGLKALSSLVGFEKGGILVGEAGPEVIGSKKDFAQFATQLTLMASKTVERKIGEKRTTETGAGGGTFPGHLKIDGELTGRGSVMKGVITHHEIQRETEVFG